MTDENRSPNRLKEGFSTLTDWLKQHPWIKKSVSFLMVLIPGAFLVMNLVQNWQALQNVAITLRWGKITLSLGIALAAFGLYPLGTQVGLRAMGARLSYRDAYYVYHSSQLAKYLPGRIWIIPGRAVVLQRFDVDPVLAGVSILLESYLMITAGVIVFIPYLLLNQQTEIRHLGIVGLFFLIPLILLILIPRLLNWLLERIMKILNRPYKPVTYSWYHLTLMLLVYILFWGMMGLGLFVLSGSFYDLPISDLVLMMGVMGFSWVVGFVSFLTPAGLGVREGAMQFLLAPFIPLPLPALIAVVARLWWSLADLGSIGLALILKKSQE